MVYSIADQDRSFSDSKFREFRLTIKIEIHLTVTRASRENVQVERVMSTMKSMLRAVEKLWQDALAGYELHN